MHVAGAVTDLITQNVTEPLPLPENPVSPAVIDEAGTAAPVVAVEGAAIVNAGDPSDTTVLTAGGQPVFDALLFGVAGNDAYHQYVPALARRPRGGRVVRRRSARTC